MRQAACRRKRPRSRTTFGAMPALFHAPQPLRVHRGVAIVIFAVRAQTMSASFTRFCVTITGCCCSAARHVPFCPFVMPSGHNGTAYTSSQQSMGFREHSPHVPVNECFFKCWRGGMSLCVWQMIQYE